jgi:hypothetical protein
MAALFFGIGTGLGPGIRAWLGWNPVFQDQVWATCLMVCVPIGFLAGIGTFDYWAHYALGKPTRPEDHSSHGAIPATNMWCAQTEKPSTRIASSESAISR